MVSNPLVTAVCPTFGRPKYLLHAVKLFLAQTWQKSELIVLDDSPKDKQPDLSRFPRVRHVKLDERLPIGSKHNMAHELGQGDVFAYFDDDDWFHPQRLVRQLDPIVRDEADLVGFRRNFVLVTGPTGGWWKIEPRGLEPRRWIGNGATNLKIPIHDGSAVYTREVAQSARHPDQTMNEKVEFLNAVWQCRWTAIKNEDLFVYVRHGKNTWTYQESLVHVPQAKPWWFPLEEVEFYRKAVA